MPAEQTKKTEVKKRQAGGSKQKEDTAYLKHGLSESQVRLRLQKFGKNTIAKKRKEGALSILLSQLKSPLIYILVIAFLITVGLGDHVDAGVIGLAVVVNTILGFYQERKAQKAIAALQAMLSPKAWVIRRGKRYQVEAKEVVPGDVCIAGLGERVPADGLVFAADDFSVTEAILTGESMPVHKKTVAKKSVSQLSLDELSRLWRDTEKDSKVFAGTIVSSGEVKLVVAVSGVETEVGKIAESLRETREEPTPLQKRISKFSNQLAVFVGLIALLIFVSGMLAGGSFVSIFATSVAVAVAAIPEGLAVSLTVILAIGMQRILKRKALVRKLMAAETLGSVTVICADKTGTLTEGVMRVTKAEFRRQELGVKAAVLSNDRRDPLEIAMWDWVRNEQGRSPEKIAESHERIDSIPFSPEEKFTAKLYEDRVYVMGAPEVVLGFCSLAGSKKERWLDKIEEYGIQGLRIVGLAERESKKGEKKLSKKSVKSGLSWLGVLVYEDPVRKGAASALEQTKKAGIDVKVITGDYRATAEAVLERLGILTKKAKLRAKQPLVMEGAELEKLSVDELRGRVAETVLFARIDPVQKLKIVEALQANGEVVAMTGDGVNDAPAIKKADIGVVVSGATDVAKETADMVLLDDNFATVAAAVEEGRGIFENLRKVILYLLSDSFSEVILVLGSLLLRIPLPLTAAQILWINLITDGFPDLALTVEPKEKDLMAQEPRSRREPLVDGEIKLLIVLISAVTGVITLGVFSWFFNRYGDLDSARTLAFAMLGVDSLLYVFSARSLRRPIWHTQVFSNPWLILAVLGGLIFQLFALYMPFMQKLLGTHPLNGVEWLLVLAEATLVIGLIELVKWIFHKKTESAAAGL